MMTENIIITKKEDNDDLVEVNTNKEGWINIFDDDSTCLWSSKEMADEMANWTRKNRVACVHVEWEE